MPQFELEDKTKVSPELRKRTELAKLKELRNEAICGLNYFLVSCLNKF